MDLENVFKNLGLGKEYSDIYSVLLEEGKLRIIDIGKKTGLPRTSCYEYMPKLIDLGLVEEERIKKSRFYKVTAPNYLFEAMYKRKQHLDYSIKNLENSYDDILGLYKNNHVQVNVEVLTDFSQILVVVKNILKRYSNVIVLYTDLDENGGELFEKVIKRSKMRYKVDSKTGRVWKIISKEFVVLIEFDLGYAVIFDDCEYAVREYNLNLNLIESIQKT